MKIIVFVNQKFKFHKLLKQTALKLIELCIFQ